MEFWPENQGQSSLYAKFGTIPGRNFNANYHDRSHQAAHYPLYYSDQQDHSRESNYWTGPGSRREGAPQQYTNWVDPELSSPTASHFPFIVDRYSQQHQDPGEYHLHEARDREWTAAQRTAKEYERGFLRDGWQRRWEPCGPARYNREVSTKRSDSSYRELEAWAARYCHSLPRRRRLEAELRGASQNLPESSWAPERDGRTGSDHRVAALQQLRPSANIRESGAWDAGGRLQTAAYYPSQAPAPGKSHTLDIKAKAGYQRKTFSQPPGYAAPPDYNSPHKSAPVTQHCDTSWEQDSKRQTYWSQPTPRKEVSVELQSEKEALAKPDESKSCAELDGVKHTQDRTTKLLPGHGPLSIQTTSMQDGGAPSLQQKETIKAVQDKNGQTTSKIIEGRKFSLNKKTGGMTIFCLVSRIAGATETPSLPLRISQANIEDLGKVANDNQASLADEVDFRGPSPAEIQKASGVTKAQQGETKTCTEAEMLSDDLANTEETQNVLPDSNSTSGKDSKPPASVKYPLWRQPSFTNRAESGNSPTFQLKVDSEDVESECLLSPEDDAQVNPSDAELGRDTESGNNNGPLAFDSSCVVVKVELIESPKKEHVHYLDCTAETDHTEPDVQSTTIPEANSEGATTDQTTGKSSLQRNDERAAEPHTESTLNNESDSSAPCKPTSAVAETLEERAQRILGIPLDDIIEQQPGYSPSSRDLRVEEQVEEIEASPLNLSDPVRPTPEETTEKEQVQDRLEVKQSEDATCLNNDDDEDQVTNEDGQSFAGSQEQPCKIPEGNDIDLQLETQVKMSAETKMAEINQLESTRAGNETEQSLAENLLVENDSSSQHSTSADEVPVSSELPPSELTVVSRIHESNKEESLSEVDEAENVAVRPETSSCPLTPLEQLPSPLPPGSSESSPASAPDTDHSLSPPPSLHVIDQTLEAAPVITSCPENGDEPSQQAVNDFNSVLEDFAKDATAELISEQSGNERPDDPNAKEESNTPAEQETEEADPSHALEQTDAVSKENATDVNILDLQLECVDAEDEDCVRQSHGTKGDEQREIESPAVRLETKTHPDNVISSPLQRKGHSENKEQEDSPYIMEPCKTEEQSQTGAGHDPAGLLEPNLSKAHTDIEILQDTEPHTELSDIDCEVSLSPSHLPSPSEDPCPPRTSQKSDTECFSQLEKESLNPHTADSALPESDCALDLDRIEEFSKVFPSESPSNLASCCTPPPLEEGESVSLDLPHKDEPQCPVSLWDAVNRIRKHTAPDSENEEDEGSEPWDPESLGGGLGFPHEVEDRSSRENVFDEEEQQDVSTESRAEDVEVGAEEDTLSCSSTTSHSSGDTVIVAEEDKVQETTLDAETERKMETDEVFYTAEEERRFCWEFKEETVAEEQKQQNVSEECTAERENVTPEITEEQADIV